MESSAQQIPINEIIVAIDGGEILRSCVLGLKHCSDVKPCPIHVEVKAHTLALREVMKKKTIGQLAVQCSKECDFNFCG